MSDELEACGKCESDYVRVESNASMQTSVISCGDCHQRIQRSVPEEDAVELWNALNKLYRLQAELDQCQWVSVDEPPEDGWEGLVGGINVDEPEVWGATWKDYTHYEHGDFGLSREPDWWLKGIPPLPSDTGVRS